MLNIVSRIETIYVVDCIIPANMPIVVPNGVYPQDFFVKRRDMTANPVSRKNFERARVLEKWAETCGGDLREIKNTSGFATFVYEFRYFDQYSEFLRHLDDALDSAMMC